jgi:hypothetical protein
VARWWRMAIREFACKSMRGCLKQVYLYRFLLTRKTQSDSFLIRLCIFLGFMALQSN